MKTELVIDVRSLRTDEKGRVLEAVKAGYHTAAAIALRTGLSEPAVRTYLRRLQQNGKIITERVPGSVPSKGEVCRRYLPAARECLLAKFY